MDIINRGIDFIINRASSFGVKENKKEESYVMRNNTGDNALNDNGAFFGFIYPEEPPSGPYHDFSFVVFPSNEGKSWLISLVVGSSGFKNDYELAAFYPGVRRLFTRLIDEKGFCKSDFSDIETNLPKDFVDHPSLQHLRKTIDKYRKVLLVCQIVEDPESEQGRKQISAFLAAYARLRDWPTNQTHRNAVSDALKDFNSEEKIDDIVSIKNLLQKRKYVVLQGAPGTGKTRAAKIMSKELEAIPFFIQFHAETSYSDFIYGIRPSLDSESSLSYKAHKGIFVEAIEQAVSDPSQNVLLVIDEINRANLSNVLGPIFYLFEYKMDESDIEIEITPELKIAQLPSNFYVIATMNTADRSLAVVDFALRRRFAWYTLVPKPITKELPNSVFFKDYYSDIAEIFEWFATGNELALQPGQGYFIANSEAEMLNRIRYEMLPLIKEYLQEGFLSHAKEEFNTFFRNRIGKSIDE